MKKAASERFLSEGAFLSLFNGVVKYIFSNGQVLNEMKENISELIANFEDTQILHQIAENFSGRKDSAGAEKVYKRILEIDPEDERASRKYNYFLALRDPASIAEDQLPPIELITDFERLRSIEVDYLNYKGASSTLKPKSNFVLKKLGGPVSEVSRKIKKNRKKRKIQFPKNFNPMKPGKRPDPERWLPKMERSKYRALAQKKGYLTKTQGSSNVRQNETRSTFTKGPTTGAKEAAKTKKKHRKR